MIRKPATGVARLIPALDTGDLARAQSLAAALAGRCGLLKVGLELFSSVGPPAIAAITPHAPVFLDVKLHDIPNTVAGALRSLAPLGPAMVTIHAGGGPAMIAAARNEAEKAHGKRPLILAVTVLTSMDSEALAATGIADAPAGQVRRLARMAIAAGADGLVCSPQEVALLRADLGPGPALVVPGIRPVGADAGDQARVATPEEAVADGADWIVVGRPITGAEDPAAAAAAIVTSLQG